MKRLTRAHYISANGHYMACSELNSCCDKECSTCDHLDEIVERLAAYEDTGLEPEICAEYKKFEDEIVASGKTFNHLIELLRAEKEGRVVVRGYWMIGEMGPCGCAVKCSACGWRFDDVDPVLWAEYGGPKYCRNCGAKMDGGEHDV